MAKNKTASILLRMSEKLKAETQKCAHIEQENLSEYARKAVEKRNICVLTDGVDLRKEYGNPL